MMVEPESYMENDIDIKLETEFEDDNEYFRSKVNLIDEREHILLNYSDIEHITDGSKKDDGVINGSSPKKNRTVNGANGHRIKWTENHFRLLAFHLSIADKQYSVTENSVLDYLFEVIKGSSFFSEVSKSQFKDCFRTMCRKFERAKKWSEGRGINSRNSNCNEYLEKMDGLCSYFAISDKTFEEGNATTTALIKPNEESAINDTNISEVIQRRSNRLKSYPELHPCPVCDGLFRSKKILDTHFVHYHDYKCTLCHNTLPNKDELITHLSTVHFEHKIDTRCNQKQLYDERSSSRVNEKPITPLKSLRPTAERKPVVKSKAPKLKARVKQTSGALKPTTNRGRYKKQVRTIAEKEKKPEFVICTSCGDSVRRDRLSHHMVRHKDIIYKCKLCDKSFKYSGSLAYHKQAAHMDKCVCSFCGVNFSTRQTLKGHIQAKHCEDTFPCEHCPSVFNNSLQRRQHIRRVHLKIKLHGCSYCDKRFYSTAHHRKHENTHTGARPFACKLNCGAAFNQKDSLKLHMRKVHGSDVPSRNKIALVGPQNANASYSDLSNVYMDPRML